MAQPRLVRSAGENSTWRWAGLPSRPARGRFLQIALRRGRQIQVKHQAHITTVNAHSEATVATRTGRSCSETASELLAGLRIQADVIRRCCNPCSLRRSAHCSTERRVRVDQRSATGHLQCLQHLRHGIPRTPLHRVVEVVPAGEAHLRERATQIQQSNDVGRTRGAAVAPRASIGTPGQRLRI